MIKECMQNKEVKENSIITTPELINSDFLKKLKNNDIKIVELDIVSTNNYVLKMCKKKHTYEDIKKASKLIKRNGFKLGFQIKIGLPESEKEDEINTIKQLLKYKPKVIRISPILVLKGTDLEKLYLDRLYTPLTIVQAVERCKEIIHIFGKKIIKIVRIGFVERNIKDDNEYKEQVVAGPYHCEFRQLVEDSIWCDSIAEKIKKINVKVKEITILANSGNVKNIIGYNNENIKKLESTYSIKINVKEDNKFRLGKFKIDINEIYRDFLDE